MKRLVEDGTVLGAEELSDPANFGTFLSPSSFWSPDASADTIEKSAWVEHGPFAFWLAETLRPRIFVELGTHYGYSYFAICQAVKQLALETNCYAVDTWTGDEHAGFYGNEVFDQVKAYHDARYSGFSRLIRSTFAEALQHFTDRSIDLLHIDGRHAYDDVKADFESWAPKLSDRSVVIFHDINVRENKFGVFRFWEELREVYPHFEFAHGHGLGVLGTGATFPAPIAALFAASKKPKLRAPVRGAYSKLGSAIADHRKLTTQLASVEHLKAELALHQAKCQQLETEVQQQRTIDQACQAELKQQSAIGQQLQIELSQQRTAAEQFQIELSQQRLIVRQLESELKSQFAAAQGFETELFQRRSINEQLGVELEYQRQIAQQFEAELAQHRRAAVQFETELTQHRRTAEQLESELSRRAELESELARRTELESELARRTEEAERSRAELSNAIQNYENARNLARERYEGLERVARRTREIEASTSWRLTAPLRAFLGRYGTLRTLARRSLKLIWWTLTFQLFSRLADRHRPNGGTIRPDVDDRSMPLSLSELHVAGDVPPLQPSNDVMPLPHYSSWGRTQRPKIVFISGEAHTPGHKYRITNIATALAPRFFEVSIFPVEDFPEKVEAISGAHVVWIWRTRHSEKVQAVINAARETGAKIIFDVDDLMFRPELATSTVIDGIRSQGFSEVAVKEMYGLVQDVMIQADHCVAPTVPLAREMNDFQKPVTVIPNGFDYKTLEVSRAARLAAIARRQTGDALVRIGYASGSRTHQKDLAAAVPALAAILAEHPETRLVLFEHTIDLTEFPELQPFNGRIEWRQFVPIEQLPEEYARFDINIAPLELGNRFCEAKSELKFFEAALVGVPTIASPTSPYKDAIAHGDNGFLASGFDEWHRYLSLLVADPALRRQIADTALNDILWKYGPARRSVTVARLINSLLSDGPAQADLARLGMLDEAPSRSPPIAVPEFDVLYQSARHSISKVAVVIPLFNYAHIVEQALDSLRGQTYRKIDVIVVDDQSTDTSAQVVEAWLRKFGDHFNNVALLQNRRNSKLGASRNVGFSFADTEYVFPLDADNMLLPDCIQKCLEIVGQTNAAVAYPRIEFFGDHGGTGNEPAWNASLFQGGNYIDAMALIRKDCWLAVGGYARLDLGWEDYDFWCKLVENGLFGVQVPTITARYRVHGSSMLRTVTNLPKNAEIVVLELSKRHSWLRLRNLSAPDDTKKSAPPKSVPAHHSSSDGTNIPALLDVIRCPETGEKLRQLDEVTLESVNSGRRWPILNGRPVFTPDGMNAIQHSDHHISNPLTEEAVRIINRARGRVLNLSAGGTSKRYPNVIEVEYSIFRNTDIVADAHNLPFDDEVFDAVVCLNAFEHYREPDVVMKNIHRILKPGGKLYLHTAFLQPLHEPPYHFFNCTEFGLAQWLQNFNIEAIQVSDNFNPVHAFSWLASELEVGLSSSVSAKAAKEFQSARVGEFVKLWRNEAGRKGPLWNNFFALSSDHQRKLSAGWEAIARK